MRVTFLYFRIMFNPPNMRGTENAGFCVLTNQGPYCEQTLPDFPAIFFTTDQHTEWQGCST